MCGAWSLFGVFGYLVCCVCRRLIARIHSLLSLSLSLSFSVQFYVAFKSWYDDDFIRVYSFPFSLTLCGSYSIVCCSSKTKPHPPFPLFFFWGGGARDGFLFVSLFLGSICVFVFSFCVVSAFRMDVFVFVFVCLGFGDSPHPLFFVSHSVCFFFVCVLGASAMHLAFCLYSCFSLCLCVRTVSQSWCRFLSFYFLFW